MKKTAPHKALVNVLWWYTCTPRPTTAETCTLPVLPNLHQEHLDIKTRMKRAGSTRHRRVIGTSSVYREPTSCINGASRTSSSRTAAREKTSRSTPTRSRSSSAPSSTAPGKSSPWSWREDNRSASGSGWIQGAAAPGDLRAASENAAPERTPGQDQPIRKAIRHRPRYSETIRKLVYEWIEGRSSSSSTSSSRIPDIVHHLHRPMQKKLASKTGA